MEKEIQINEREYRIKQYRLHERLVFHARVTKLFGVGATVVDGLIDGYVDDDLTLDKLGFGDAIKNITDKIDPEIHAKFIEDTIGKLTVSPTVANTDQKTDKKKFESYFTEHFIDVYPLFTEIVEFNVSDSLSEELKKKLMSYVDKMFNFMEEQTPESEQNSTPQTS